MVVLELGKHPDTEGGGGSKIAGGQRAGDRRAGPHREPRNSKRACSTPGTIHPYNAGGMPDYSENCRLSEGRRIETNPIRK